MRASHQVPQDEFTNQGRRVSYTDRFRGQDVMLKGTVTSERWERSLGTTVYRVQPDLVEGMEGLTTYPASVRSSRLTFEEASV